MSKSRKRRRSRAHSRALPKGAYRLPGGNYVTTSAGDVVYRGRRITVVGVRRAEPNLQLLATVLLDLAREQIEAGQRRKLR